MSLFVCTSNKGKLSEFSKMLSDQEEIVGINELNLLSKVKYFEPIENSNYFFSNALVKIFSALKYLENNKEHIEFTRVHRVIVDDSGLCVPALSYLPGVHSATYAGSPKDDKNNRHKLIDEINKSTQAFNVNNHKRLPAFFVCFLIEISVEEKESYDFLRYFDFNDAQSLVNEKVKQFEGKCLSSVDLAKIGGAFTEEIPLSFFYEKISSSLIIKIHYGFCSGEVSSIEQNLIPTAGHGYDSLFYSIEDKNLSFASISMEEKNKISHRAFAMKEMLKLS